MDIYGDTPDRDYDNVLFELRIGRNFMIHVQVQHGFARAACFTSSGARWISPVLVNDQENFEMLLSDVCEEVINKSRPESSKVKLKVVRGGDR